MKCYQVFYNSAAETLDGSTGFGVTSVTEGIPAEYVKLFATNAYLRTYNSGKFDFDDPSREIAEHPEKVYEYPRKYQYVKVEVDGRALYIIERVVNTVFDNDFYSTGEGTRPGNFVVHALLFEDFPGKDIFHLLYEAPKEGALHFLPDDWAPRKDNPELVDLMIKSPRRLPVSDSVFDSHIPPLRKEAIDLFFSYRDSILMGLPLVVSMADADTRMVCGGLMSILPDEIARDATFVINHQYKGYSVNARISFVNEHYLFQVNETNCYHADFLKGNRNVSAIERMWRDVFSEAIRTCDEVRMNKLAAWIYGDMAVALQDRPADLNMAIFDYCCVPESFKLMYVDSIQDILSVISDALSRELCTLDRLVDLLCSEFTSAEKLEEYEEAIRLTEKVDAAGINVAEVFKVARQQFTSYLLSHPANLTKAVAAMSADLLMKYADKKMFPSLKTVVAGSMGCDVDQIIGVAAFLEESPVERVRTYVQLLKETPSQINEYAKLLSSDGSESRKVDYLTEFKDFHSDESFAHFFYEQLMRELPDMNVRDSLRRLFEMQEINPMFATLLLSDLRVYDELYGRTTGDMKKEDYPVVRDLAEKYVLPVLSKESSVSRKWRLLRDVLAAEVSEKTDVPSYYSLAVKLDADDAVRKIALKCFEEMPVDEAESIVKELKDKNALTDKQMLDAALASGRHGKKGWLVAVARAYGYDYDAIAEAAKEFGLNTKDEIKTFMKKYFKKEYSAHRRQTFMNKLKALFAKKK